MAVIAALLVVIAAAAAATQVIERQGLLANVLISERNRAQAAWLLQGGLDWARVVLQTDARGNATTRLDGIWSQPIISMPVGTADDPDHALFSGQIEDAQGKYNLRNLADRARINPHEVQVLENLLQWLDIDTSLAMVMAQRVADSQFGEETMPKAVGLRDVDDLRALQGVTPHIIDVLQAFVTVLPDITPVNVNTAPAEVLGAVVDSLGLAGARKLVAQREQGLWFTNRGDFVNRTGHPEPDPKWRISVNSSWFRVTGEVDVDDMIVSLRAMLYRSDQGLSTIRWVSY
ncbi:general secretion pathway protein GspK [Allopusillimonas ginsengisoli]|nr:general secretion pathway protein GspK [Allopusillimonas ginsengisoli]